MAKSYKEKFKGQDGVWRTIGGRRVFIRTGQSLTDAMKESGKFKLNKKEEEKKSVYYDDIQNAKTEDDLQRILNEHDSVITNTRKESAQFMKEWSEKAKEIRNNKEDYEYNLYKKAMTDPDSIDPMTENSTDWEALDKKYRDKYNSLSKVKNNRVVENVNTGSKYYEIGNGQWRSEEDGYDYYIDFNSSNKDNPTFKDVASGRIINDNPRADNYWDYEGNGLKSKYKGTIDYLKETTNMSGNEILELLKKIEQDKK